jgi:hypothetical protein
MEKWEDYPIKVLDIAPLIMVTLPTVSSISSTCGCFLWVEWSFSWMIPLLFSLSSLWTASRANGSLLCKWQSLHEHRVDGSSHARKGGAEPTPEWDRPTGPVRPAQAHPGPVRSPFRSRGSSCIYAVCPLHLHNFDDVIHASKMFSLHEFWLFTLQSLGMFLWTLQSLPPLGVISSSSQTRMWLLNCSFEFAVTLSFISMCSYKNITLPNAHTKINLLYH